MREPTSGRVPIGERVFQWYDRLPIWDGVHDPAKRHTLQAIGIGTVALGIAGAAYGLNKKIEADNQLSLEQMLSMSGFSKIPEVTNSRTHSPGFHLPPSTLPEFSDFIEKFKAPHSTDFANGTYSNPESVLLPGWNRSIFTPQENGGFLRLPPLHDGEDWKIYAKAQEASVDGFYMFEGSASRTDGIISGTDYYKMVWLQQVLQNMPGNTVTNSNTPLPTATNTESNNSIANTGGFTQNSVNTNINTNNTISTGLKPGVDLVILKVSGNPRPIADISRRQLFGFR